MQCSVGMLRQRKVSKYQSSYIFRSNLINSIHGGDDINRPLEVWYTENVNSLIWRIKMLVLLPILVRTAYLSNEGLWQTGKSSMTGAIRIGLSWVLLRLYGLQD